MERLRLAQRRLHWFVDHSGHKYEGTREQGEKLTLRAIESGGNNFLIVLVTGIGFFTDSYILFASNAIMPMLGYVYWNDYTSPSHEIAINAALLSGCICGMLIFGFLGDIYGRRKMYGIELIILIVGTVGVVMSSAGFSPQRSDTSAEIDWASFGSMDIVSWLIWWRFVTGIGLGGDYPLSATIVSEFAPTKRRATMLAAVFSMQAFGYAAATIVSLIVVTVVKSHHPEPSPRAVDQIWRWVIGLGLVPACLAVVLRLTIPESPRWTLFVRKDTDKAVDETRRFNFANMLSSSSLAEENNESDDLETQPKDEGEVTVETTDCPGISESNLTVKNYFWERGYWRILAGTALTWFLLDVAFFALSLNNPQVISKLWYQTTAPSTQLPVWNTDFDGSSPEQDVYQILTSSSTHSLALSSAGGLVGAILMVIFINRFNRKRLQMVTFTVLAALFIIVGATFGKTVQTGFHGVTLTLSCLCQFVFYFGPNTLTFMIPAELFPTKFRTSCHGISAAAGKLGSLVIQLFLSYAKFKDNGSSQETGVGDPRSKWLGWILLFLALPMLLGALTTWCCIPNLQQEDRANLSLEALVDVPIPKIRGTWRKSPEQARTEPRDHDDNSSISSV